MYLCRTSHHMRGTLPRTRLSGSNVGNSASASHALVSILIEPLVHASIAIACGESRPRRLVDAHSSQPKLVPLARAHPEPSCRLNAYYCCRISDEPLCLFWHDFCVSGERSRGHPHPPTRGSLPWTGLEVRSTQLTSVTSMFPNFQSDEA